MYNKTNNKLFLLLTLLALLLVATAFANTDLQAPVVLTKSATIYLNESGKAALSVSDIDDGSNDNAGIKTMTLSKKDFKVADTGDVSVTLTVTDNSDNISASMTLVTIIDTFKRDPSGKVIANTGLGIFPNPTNGIFTVSVPADINGGEATVTDMMGKLIERKMFMPASKPGFNISYAPKGDYIVQVANGNNIYTTKVVVE